MRLEVSRERTLTFNINLFRYRTWRASRSRQRLCATTSLWVRRGPSARAVTWPLK